MSAIPTGADLIAAERRRQIEVEGWTSKHDREHGATRLSQAADCYAGYVTRWPWEPAAFKPKGPLRNLIRAGALYQAAADACDPQDDRTETLFELRNETAARVDVLLAEVAEVLA
jgi:hypothetical protein